MNKISYDKNTVPRETFTNVNELVKTHQKRLENYLDLLLWWNKKVNLVSRNVPRETIWEHIRHSLLLTELEQYQSANHIVDAGSGGGLPGIPLSISHPEKQFILNDIVSKKCMAMKQMIRKLRLTNVSIIDGSVENIDLKKDFLLISKHAFKIDELLQMTSHLPWQTMMLYKGIDFQEELSGIKKKLHIEAHELSNGSNFYTDKAIVVINRS